MMNTTDSGASSAQVVQFLSSPYSATRSFWDGGTEQERGITQLLATVISSETHPKGKIKEKKKYTWREEEEELTNVFIFFFQ